MIRTMAVLSVGLFDAHSVDVEILFKRLLPKDARRVRQVAQGVCGPEPVSEARS